MAIPFSWSRWWRSWSGRASWRSKATGWTLRGDLEAVAVGVPESVRHSIDQQLAQVSPEVQDIMEAASVGGIEFSAAAVAAAVDQTVEDVEACCDALARRGQFVRSLGLAEWPDGTVATRYGFLHGLYPRCCMSGCR